MDEQQITSLDEAREALDAEIANVQQMVDIYKADIDEAKRKSAPYEQSLWRLRSLRRRMNEPVALEVVQTEDAAA